MPRYTKDGITLNFETDPSDEDLDEAFATEAKHRQFKSNLDASAGAAEAPSKLGTIWNAANEMIQDPGDLADDALRLAGVNSHIGDLAEKLGPLVAPKRYLQKVGQAGDELATAGANTGEPEIASIAGALGGALQSTGKTAEGLASPLGLALSLAGAGEAKATTPALKTALKTVGNVGATGFGLQGTKDIAEGLAEGDYQKVAMGLSMVSGGLAHAAHGTAMGNAPVSETPRRLAAIPVRAAGKVIESGVGNRVIGGGLGALLGAQTGIPHASYYGGAAGARFADTILPKKHGTALIDLADRMETTRPKVAPIEDQFVKGMDPSQEDYSDPQGETYDGPEVNMDEVNQTATQDRQADQAVKGPEVQEYAPEVDPAIKDLSEKITAQTDRQAEASLLQQEPVIEPEVDPVYRQEADRLRILQEEDKLNPRENSLSVDEQNAAKEYDARLRRINAGEDPDAIEVEPIVDKPVKKPVLSSSDKPITVEPIVEPQGDHSGYDTTGFTKEQKQAWDDAMLGYAEAVQKAAGNPDKIALAHKILKSDYEGIRGADVIGTERPDSLVPAVRKLTKDESPTITLNEPQGQFANGHLAELSARDQFKSKLLGDGSPPVSEFDVITGQDPEPARAELEASLNALTPEEQAEYFDLERMPAEQFGEKEYLRSKELQAKMDNARNEHMSKQNDAANKRRLRSLLAALESDNPTDYYKGSVSLDQELEWAKKYVAQAEIAKAKSGIQDPLASSRRASKDTTQLRKVPYDKNHPLQQIQDEFNRVLNEVGYEPGLRLFPEQEGPVLEALKALEQKHNAEHGVPVIARESQFKGTDVSPVERQLMLNRVNALLAEQAKVNPQLVQHMKDQGFHVEVAPINGKNTPRSARGKSYAGLVQYGKSNVMKLFQDPTTPHFDNAVFGHESGHVVIHVIMTRIAKLDMMYKESLNLRGPNDPMTQKLRESKQAMEGDLEAFRYAKSPVSDYASSYKGKNNSMDQVDIFDPQSGHAGQSIFPRMNNEEFADLYSGRGPHRTMAYDLVDHRPTPAKLATFVRLLDWLSTKPYQGPIR